MKRIAAAIAMCAVTCPPSATMSQDRGVELGVLDCAISGGTGFIVGSTKDLRCTFNPADTKFAPESYFGVVSKYGLDIGTTKQTVMQWIVLAPMQNIYAPGALAGDYVGASAQANVGIGAGANALIGGFDKSITLQPLSLEGSKGLNVAAGIGSISLKSVPNS